MSDRRTGALIAGIAALGLALRIAGARGGLWLDEAWSAVLATEVGTPAGVLFGINHDNNHHLNSLWLQAVGLAAPSWLMRAPAILCGTLGVPVAAAIARPAGRLPAIVAALLFAVSPLLVTLGSEARGYAPMALALLVAILFVDRTLAGDARYRRPRVLALCFALGALAQLTMVFGVLALCGWAVVTWWRRSSFGVAVRESLRLFAWPLAALAAILALVALAALASPTGFRFGSYEPFTWSAYRDGLVCVVGYAIGWPATSVLLPAAALVLLAAAPRWQVARIELYRLAILAFPLALALLRSGNPGYPRYYLLAGIALLLLLAEVIGRGLAQAGPARWAAGVTLAIVSGGSLMQDARLAVDRRGDPAAAVRMLAQLAPGGTVVGLYHPSGRAPLVVAAAQQRYSLRLVADPCPPPEFVFANRGTGQPAAPRLVRCGVSYLPVIGAEPHGLSGSPWTLYRRTS